MKLSAEETYLKAALEVVAQRCEDDIQGELSRLHAEARYDGSRFRVPSFQDVGAVWIRLVKQQEKVLKAEISRVFEVPSVVFSRSELAEAQRAVERLFSSERYVDRLIRFTEGIGRQAARYGVQFSSADYRIDLVDAAYRVGVANALTEARVNVLAELRFRQRSSTPDVVVSLSKGWSYLLAHPLKAILVTLLVVSCYVVDKVGWSHLLASP